MKITILEMIAINVFYLNLSIIADLPVHNFISLQKYFVIPMHKNYRTLNC